MKRILLQRPFLVFFLLVLADLIAILWNVSRLEYLVKPLLMPALALTFFSFMVKKPGRKLITAGLFFSWLGDICLLLESRNALFFIAGLASFLITHGCYIIYFLSIRSVETSFLKKQPIYILLTLCYGMGLVWLLFPYLGQLKLPVILYATVICSMLLCSIHIYLKVKKPSNRYFATGAGLFVLSDSILAVNKFYQPLSLAGIWIMVSYCAAQYFIVSGFIGTRINTS